MQKEEGEGGTESRYQLARPLDSDPEAAFLVLIQALLKTWWPEEGNLVSSWFIAEVSTARL